MKANRFFQTVIILFSAIVLISCNALTYVGKVRDSKFPNDIVLQTLKWDSRASADDVRRDFTAFVRQTLFETRYQDFLLLYQSNAEMAVGERTYLIKIFKTTNDKNAFMAHSQDVVARTRALSLPDFTTRWQQLEDGMAVENVFTLLPELAEFHTQQRIYSSHSQLYLADYWFSFDLLGFLVDFGRGNAPQSNRANEWVF